MKRKIVCAANKLSCGVILCGVRHWDMLMNNQADAMGVDGGEEIQGFVDNGGEFLTREQAWEVAEAAGQIKFRVGGDSLNGGHLFSENLY